MCEGREISVPYFPFCYKPKTTLKIVCFKPHLLWLSWLDITLQIERSPVQFHGRQWEATDRCSSLASMFLSLSFFLLSPLLKINSKIKSL